MAEHVHVTAAAGAPMLMAGRRGAAPVLGVAPIMVEARIPLVSPADLGEMRIVVRNAFLVRDGRLWRPVTGRGAQRPDGDVDPSAMTLHDALAALSGGGAPDVRHALRPLFLDPAYVRNQWGHTGPWPREAGAGGMPEGDHPLDLRAEAADAIRDRLARDAVTDGTDLWLAVDPPEIRGSGHPGLWCKLGDTVGLQDVDFPCPSSDTDLYAAFDARDRFRGERANDYAVRLRELAAELRGQLQGVDRDPLDEVARFVRLHAPLAFQAISRSTLREDRRGAVRALRAGLMPLVARAAAGLVPRAGLAEAVDRMVVASVAALDAAASGEGGLWVQTLSRVVDYAEEVARPILARRPFEAEDVEALDGVAPARP